MHIPDGFLTLLISAITWAIAITFLAFSFWRLGKEFNERQIPLMATLTAMFFAAQMVNYPLIGGTTAHLLGGPILAITLGPYAALVSMTVILVIQAFFFGDGGILTLGANIVNMGIVGVLIPWIVFILIYRLIPSRNGMIAGGFLGAFAGAMLLEFINTKNIQLAFKVGLGALFGAVGGKVTKLLVSIVMIVLIVFRLF